MTTITPTVGRVVHVYIDGNYALNHEPELAIDTPLAAIIARVISDERVNLTVFNHDGNAFALQAVFLVSGDQVPSGENYAVWMPYQKGQAAKTEQLESMLTGSAMGVDMAAGKDETKLVRVFLEKGSIVKVEGIPLELEHDVVVRSYPCNVPLIFPPRTALRCESAGK